MSSRTPRYARATRGREELRSRVKQSLRIRRRVVSLVGPGGVGKTRLAAAAVEGDRHVWVSLAGVRDVDDVPEAVATALDLVAGEQVEAEVAEAVGSRIVVLDGVEQLDIGPLLERWVDASPRAVWLVTSRMALQLDPERVIEVPPLDVPERIEDLETSASVALFRDAAPDPAALDRHPDETLKILQLTAGLPLAIEIAAARLTLLTLPLLRQRLDERYFATLRDPMRPERALRELLEDVWTALDPAVQQSLVECAAFAGSFDLADAEQVLTAGPLALDHLHTLRAAQLVSAAEGRLWLLEPVRRFAMDRMDERADGAEMLNRHAAWVAARVDESLENLRESSDLDALWTFGGEMRLCVDRGLGGQVDDDYAIVCANGLVHAMVTREANTRLMTLLQRALALSPTGHWGKERRNSLLSYYVQRLAAQGDTDAAIALGEQQLAGTLTTLERADMSKELGSAMHMAGRLAEARVLLERAVDIGWDTDVRSWAEIDLALVAHDEGKPQEVAELLARARDSARGDERVLCRHAEIAAAIAVERRDVEEGERAIARFLEVARSLGDSRKVGLAQLFAGELREVAGDLEAARERVEQGRELLVGVDADTLVSRADGQLGRIALQSGELARAAGLLGSWERVWTQTGTEAATYSAVLAALRGDVEAAVRAAADSGTALAELAVHAARLVSRPLSDPPDPAATKELVERAERFSDPIERRLAQRLAGTADARWAGWVVSADGTWVRTPEGETLSLGRSRANAAMLVALAGTHGRGPLGVDDLVQAVWPGERLVKKAARARVYVALSGLRKAGLGPLILRSDGGWELDPGQPVFVEDLGLHTRI